MVSECEIGCQKGQSYSSVYNRAIYKASPRILDIKNRMRVTICLVLSFTLAKDHLAHNSVSRLLNDESSKEQAEFPEQKEFHQVKTKKKSFH